MRSPADMAQLALAREKSKRLRIDHEGVRVELGAETFVYRRGVLASYQNDNEYRRVSSFERAPEAMEAS
jgi:hypothetical protein